MTLSDPLPFRLKVPSHDSFDLEGLETVSYRMEGLLHLKDDLVSLEWTGTRKTEYLTVTGVGTEHDHYPVTWIEIPVAWITEARMRGGWLSPRLELRARRLDAFRDVPSARADRLILRVARRDRERAREMAVAIELARAEAAIAAAEGSGVLDAAPQPERETDSQWS